MFNKSEPFLWQLNIIQCLIQKKKPNSNIHIQHLTFSISIYWATENQPSLCLTNIKIKMISVPLTKFYNHLLLLLVAFFFSLFSLLVTDFLSISLTKGSDRQIPPYPHIPIEAGSYMFLAAEELYMMVVVILFSLSLYLSLSFYLHFVPALLCFFMAVKHLWQ